MTIYFQLSTQERVREREREKVSTRLRKKEEKR